MDYRTVTNKSTFFFNTSQSQSSLTPLDLEKKLWDYGLRLYRANVVEPKEVRVFEKKRLRYLTKISECDADLAKWKRLLVSAKNDREDLLTIKDPEVRHEFLASIDQSIQDYQERINKTNFVREDAVTRLAKFVDYLQHRINTTLETTLNLPCGRI